MASHKRKSCKTAKYVVVKAHRRRVKKHHKHHKHHKRHSKK